MHVWRRKTCLEEVHCASRGSLDVDGDLVSLKLRNHLVLGHSLPLLHQQRADGALADTLAQWWDLRAKRTAALREKPRTSQIVLPQKAEQRTSTSGASRWPELEIRRDPAASHDGDDTRRVGLKAPSSCWAQCESMMCCVCVGREEAEANEKQKRTSEGRVIKSGDAQKPETELSGLPAGTRKLETNAHCTTLLF